jgi:plasmid stability protein
MQIGCSLMVVPKTIQIRNVPDDIHRRLRTRAAAAGMSLSDYLLNEISRVAGRPTMTEVLERARLRGDSGVSSEDIVAVIRAARDA